MKSTAISIVIAGALIGGAIFYSGARSAGGTDVPADNVSIVDGKQIIEVSVQGGYRPRKSIAKAGVPTTLRFVTNNTYDCSAAVRIPGVGYSAFLPSTGKTDVSLGTPQAGVLRGSCAMGMYTFEIDFQK